MKRLLIPLCLALTVAQAQAPQARTQDLASLLPAETLLLFEADDLGGMERWARETALGRIWAEPEVQHFIEGLHKAVFEGIKNASGGSDPLGMVGLSLDDLMGIEVRHAGFALVDASFAEGGPPEVDALIAVQFRHGADKAAKIMGSIQEAATTFLGVSFEPVEIRGRKVWRTLAPGHDPCIFMHGDHLILTSLQSRMERMLTAIDEGQPEPLAAAPRFANIVKRMGAERRAVLCYVDLPAIKDKLARVALSFVGEEPVSKFEYFWNLLGLDAIEAVALADIPVGTGYRTELAVTYSESRGLLALVPPGKVNHRFARHVPAGALAYAAENSDLEGYLDRMTDLVGQFMPEARSHVEEFMAQAKEHIGVNPREDILQALGADWAAYVGAPPQGGLVPDAAVFCTVRDRAKLEKALDTVAHRLAGMAAEKGEYVRPGVTHFRGVKIRFVEMAQRGGDPIPVVPSWAFVEDYLVMALCPQTIKHSLMDKPALAGNEDFRALLRLIPDTTMSCTYIDTKGLVGWLYNTGVPVLQALQGAINQQVARFGVRLNLQDLPPAEVITRHMSGTMLYTAVEDGFCRTGYVSPFGAPLVAAAASTGVLAGMVVMLIPKGMAVARREAEAEAVPETPQPEKR